MSSGEAKPMVLIAGPCVIEDEALVLETAAELKHQLQGLPLEFYFKSSFDKANRTSIEGFRGPGMREGLRILEKAKGALGVPLLTDVHETEQVEPVGEVVDFLQVPAFLCRQTDLVLNAARVALRRGKRLNVKKGQFLAPWDAKNIIEKARWAERNEGGSHRGDWFCVTERGVSFGYNTLVVDMTSFQTIQRFGVPVIFDATHSVQSPGAAPGGKSTGGKRENIEVLARAAIAAGADGIFMECHPDPARAKSDGPNAFYLDHVGDFVKQLLRIRELMDRLPKVLPESQLS